MPSRFANSACPIFVGSLLAPTTATDCGCSSRAMERDSIMVVDVDESLEIAVRDAWVCREVAQVAGALRQSAMEGDQRFRVVGADRSQVHRSAVGGDDVRLPMPRGLLSRAGHPDPAP